MVMIGCRLLSESRIMVDFRVVIQPPGQSVLWHRTMAWDDDTKYK